MKLTQEQQDAIIKAIQETDYGRVIVEVCGTKDHVDVIVERRVRVRKGQGLVAPPSDE